MVYGGNPSETFLGRDLGAGRNYSEEVASEIDAEIREMLDEAFETARVQLSQHMQQLHVVAQALIEREKLSGDEFRTLMSGGCLLYTSVHIPTQLPRGCGHWPAPLLRGRLPSKKCWKDCRILHRNKESSLPAPVWRQALWLRYPDKLYGSMNFTLP